MTFTVELHNDLESNWTMNLIDFPWLETDSGAFDLDSTVVTNVGLENTGKCKFSLFFCWGVAGVAGVWNLLGLMRAMRNKCGSQFQEILKNWKMEDLGIGPRAFRMSSEQPFELGPLSDIPTDGLAQNCEP